MLVENKFLNFDFHANAGQIVEVTLDKAANVLLLDNTDFDNYRNGRQFRYIGGQARVSPVRIKVPFTGYWHLVVDLGGYAGAVRAAARLVGG